MNRRRATTAVAAFALCLSLFATTAAAQQMPAPDEVLRNAIDEVLLVLQDRQDEFKNNPKALHTMVRERVLTIFDSARIARLILGRHYRTATPEQIEKFTEEFREFLIRTYADAVFNLGDIDIRYYEPVYDKKKKKALVKTTVKLAAAEPVPVQYKLSRDAEKRWKIYEVTVAGLSLIGNYRTIYGSIISRKGLDGLISDLASRNATPAQ